MNEPPRKRRRTSSPPPALPSPLRKPPRRPSFASPTKASLARSYPSLLPTQTPLLDKVRAQAEQARASVLNVAGTPPENTTEGPEEETESPSAEPQGRSEIQEGPSRGILFSSPGKRPTRAPGAVTRPPPRDAPAVQQDQPTKPEEAALDRDDQTEKRAQKSRPDPEVERRRQERARLQREVEELEAQVSRCTKEIAAEQQRAADDTLLPAQRADLNKFIAKISGADAHDERPTPVSRLLCSFLPFSSLAVSHPKQTQAERPIASHQPVALKDPLPYLEMFTSFDCSTQPGLPRGKDFTSSKRIYQKHVITMSGPQKLLTAQVTINIDCFTNKVVDMHVLRLPSWAQRELGVFMRAKAQEQDLGNACWAVESFWDIALKRAQHWHRCEKAFAQLLPGHTAEDVENVTNTDPKSSTLSRKDLSRHLGRDVLILQDRHVLLKLNWRIVFDWTGEAESNVDVECAVPAVWKEADAGDAFRKVSETFDSLLRTKGAFQATKIIVALLFAQ